MDQISSIEDYDEEHPLAQTTKLVVQAIPLDGGGFSGTFHLELFYREDFSLDELIAISDSLLSVKHSLDLIIEGES